MTVDLIIWDFDGTLAYRDGMWSGAMIEVLNQHRPGHGIVADDVRPHLRDRFPWHAPDEAHPHLSDPDAWWDSLRPVFDDAYVALGFGSEEAQELSGYVRDIYCDPEAWRVYPEVREALSVLDNAGWGHVVLSNHVPELESILDALGIASHFRGIFSSAVIGHEKPNSAAFHYVLAKVGPCRRVWVVGDNPVADIGGADVLGIPGILVRREDSSVSRCCADLREVIRIIGVHGRAGAVLSTAAGPRVGTGTRPNSRG